MSLPAAYCRQLDEVIDIVRAHDYYFSQEEPYQDLDFLCPDEQCRNTEPQLIVGINYNKLPKIDKIVQKPHFRLIHPEKHRNDCPWVEVKEAIDELDAEPGLNRFSNLKRSDVIDVFDPSNGDVERENPRIDAALVRAVSLLGTRVARINAYKAYLRDNPNRTSRLQEVVSCFKKMTPDELDRTTLYIDGVGEKTYRQHFKAAQYCSPSINGNYIYYGTVTIEHSPDGFTLTFYQTAQQKDGQAAAVSVCISNHMLDNFRGNGVVLATFLAAQEIGGNVLFCCAFGAVERTDQDNNTQLNIQIQSLHSLSVMLRE